MFCFSCSVCVLTRHDVRIHNMPGTPGWDKIPSTSGIVQMVYPYPGIVPQSNRTHKSSGYGYGSLAELTEVPGMEVVYNSQAFRVRYGSFSELTEVPGRYTDVVPVPRVLCHWRTKLSEVSGTAMNVVHNSQKLRLRVWKSYITYRTSCTGNTRENTLDMVLCVL